MHIHLCIYYLYVYIHLYIPIVWQRMLSAMEENSREVKREVVWCSREEWYFSSNLD